MSYFLSSLKRRHSPLGPLCCSSGKMGWKVRLGMPSKKAANCGRLTMISSICLCWALSSRKTEASMATSPIAEKRITSTRTFFIFPMVFFCKGPDLAKGHYTFSFACRPSYIYLLTQYRTAVHQCFVINLCAALAICLIWIDKKEYVPAQHRYA